MDFANTKKALATIGTEIVRNMRLNLGAVRKRKSYRSTWKGNKPTSTKIKYRKSNSIASGKLWKSIKSRVTKNMTIEISQLSYGTYIEKGRRGKAKIPPSKEIARWTKMKKIPVRDLETGKFKKTSKIAKSGQSFVIARSIAWYGIEAYPYQAMAVKKVIEKERGNLITALKKDIQDGIND